MQLHHYIFLSLVIVAGFGIWFYRRYFHSYPPADLSFLIDGTPFYVKIPINLSPVDRGITFEDPIIQAFEYDKLGSIVGGGTMISPDGDISYCGIDLTIADIDRGLPILRDVLIRQGAPGDTVIIQLEPTEIEHPLKPEG